MHHIWCFVFAVAKLLCSPYQSEGACSHCDWPANLTGGNSNSSSGSGSDSSSGDREREREDRVVSTSASSHVVVGSLPSLSSAAAAASRLL